MSKIDLAVFDLNYICKFEAIVKRDGFKLIRMFVNFFGAVFDNCLLDSRGL